jgi:DNA-binding NarL/FixJ family response regulator
MNAILIIESSLQESNLLIAGLRDSLVDNPIRVITSCKEAIQYLEGTNDYVDRERYPLPAILFLKIPMPNQEAFEFLTWFKSRAFAKGTLVVAVGGDDNFAAMRRAYQSGVHTFITHPSRAQEVENLIKGFPGPWERRPGVQPGTQL